MVKLKDISIPVTEKVGKRKLTPVSISAGIGFVPQAEKFGRDISGNQYELYTVIRDGEFVFNKGNSKTYPEGAVYLLEGWGEVAAPNVFIGFKLKKGYRNDFFKYLFEKNVHGRELRPHITSGARSNGLLNISKETFFSINLPATSEAEQTHIAACLSSLDAVITAHTDKLDALREHKRGLMQQLFPVEGERLPRLRFPEFDGAGEWEESTIGANTLKVGSGITPSGGDSNYRSSGRPFVRSQNVGWGKLIINDMAFIDEDTHSTFLATEIKLADVLLNITGASIGRATLADGKVIGGNVNQHVCIIRANTEKILPKYLLQFLLSENGQGQIDSFQAGGNRQGLNFAQIRSFKLPLPKRQEQQRIAACLFSLDDLVTAQVDKVTALQEFKRRLMQGLLPLWGEE